MISYSFESAIEQAAVNQIARPRDTQDDPMIGSPADPSQGLSDIDLLPCSLDSDITCDSTCQR